MGVLAEYEKSTNLILGLVPFIDVSTPNYFIFYYIVSLICFKSIRINCWIKHAKNVV